MRLSTIIYLIGTENKHTLEMCFAAHTEIWLTVPDMTTIWNWGKEVGGGGGSSHSN